MYVRYCWDNLCRLLLVHFIKQSAQDWEKKKNSDKIKYLREKKIFPKDVCECLDKIRKVGNKGAHEESHQCLKSTEIEEAKKYISRIGEWTLLQYFKDHGLLEQPWVLSIFSILPPKYRVNILEKLYLEKEIEYKEKHLDIFPIPYHSFEDNVNEIIKSICNKSENNITLQENKKLQNEFIILIDKLSMAYLKNNEYDKSIILLNKCKKEHYIDIAYYEVFLEKIDMLHTQFQQGRLPISKNLNDSKIKFTNEILPSINPRYYTFFLVVFAAIIAPEKVDSIKDVLNLISKTNNTKIDS